MAPRNPLNQRGFLCNFCPKTSLSNEVFELNHMTTCFGPFYGAVQFFVDIIISKSAWQDHQVASWTNRNRSAEMGARLCDESTRWIRRMMPSTET